MVKDFSASNKQEQIGKLIRVLEEFAMSHNPHTRKGGLIGLAAVAIGLGTRVRLGWWTFVTIFKRNDINWCCTSGSGDKWHFFFFNIFLFPFGWYPFNVEKKGCVFSSVSTSLYILSLNPRPPVDHLSSLHISRQSTYFVSLCILSLYLLPLADIDIIWDV